MHRFVLKWYDARMNAKPTISLIAAITKTLAIGNKGDLVVRISDDLKRFKALTTGHPIIMGRKTYQSIGRPLPNRTNIVVSRDVDLKIEGAIVCKTLDEAFNVAASKEQDEIFVIGGGEIYRQSLPRADKLYLTLVDVELPGDVFFPDYSAFTRVIKKEDRTDEKSGLKYSWIDLER